MAVIIEERGRGKFKPAPDYAVDEVKELLNAKIEEERQAFADCSEEIDFDKLKYDSNKWNLISLFSGCGGLDLGFELAGLKAVMGENVMEAAFADKKVFDENINNNVFNTIYVNDIFDEARETYAQNAGKYIYMDKSDIRKIKEFPKADIVLGGFPCPGFSEAGPRLVDDKRNFLYLHFIRCLMQSKPKIFVAENVKGMMTLHKGKIFERIIKAFEEVGYTTYTKLFNAADYGVPQRRERVIIVGIRNDLNDIMEYSFPKETNKNNWIPLSVAVPELAIEQEKYYFSKRAVQGMKNAKNNMKRGLYQDLDKPCLTVTSHLAKVSLNSRDPVLLVDPDKELYRRFTPLEAARIQSFPDEFEFAGSETDAYRQIGNAIPPVMFWHISNSIKKYLEMVETVEQKEAI